MKYTILFITLLFLLSGCASLHKGLSSGPDHISLGDKANGPAVWAQFCEGGNTLCEKTSIKRIALTDAHWDLMNKIDIKYNKIPESDTSNRQIDLYPDFGDCKDIAATKMDALSKSDLFDKESLGLAVVRTSDGIRHMVTLIYATDKDYVLDNMHKTIWPWHKLDYTWVRIMAGGQWYGVGQ